MPTIEILPPENVPERRARRRHRRSAGRRRWLAWFSLTAGLTLLAGGVAALGPFVLADSNLPSVPSAPPLAGPELLLHPRRPTPPVYAYSVVPGGVHAADEALAAAQDDPVVADHYEGIDLAALRVTHVDSPRAVHVSYRIGDRVYWTKRKIQLQPGEVVLSDGSAGIRARCGNCVSDVLRGPVSDQEPAPDVFDRPVATAGTTPGGGLTPLQAYDLFSGMGALPPALGGSALAPSSPFAAGGVSGLGGVGGSGFGGVPAGFSSGGGGAGGGVIAPTSNRTPASDENPAPPPFGDDDGFPPPGGGGGGNPFNPPPGGGGPTDGGTPPGGDGGNPTDGGDGGTPSDGGDGGTPSDGGDGDTNEPPEQVPEPGTLLLLAGGLSALAARRLRHR